MSKPQWQHEGVYYGRTGTWVGSFYNNEHGWYVILASDPHRVTKVRSRNAAIKAIEVADVQAALRSSGGGT